MTPLDLLGIIALLIVLRVAIGFVPVAAAVDARFGGDAQKTGEPLSAVIREYLDAFVMAGIAALFLITFVVRTFYIPSGSMIPTLQIKDVLIVSEYEYKFGDPHRGDIAVFKPPKVSSSDFIKRVIGAPGDQLRVQDGTVYRNGAALSEPYILQRPAYDMEVRDYGIYVDGVRLSTDAANIPPKSAWKSPDRIPPGCFIMFGDNRNDSEDSHVWGCAQSRGTFASGELRGERAQFTGHAVLVFWPLDRLRILH